jgi:hypothetical protein
MLKSELVQTDKHSIKIWRRRKNLWFLGRTNHNTTRCTTFGKEEKITEFYIKYKVMTGIETIKNNLIDRILATRNEKLLQAISNIFESIQTDDIVSLSSEQIEMLLMSEKDIESGNLISESELNESDSKWLN